MSLDYLTLDIRYHLKEDRFEVAGDVNEKGRISLIETFLRGQIGAGRDESKVIKRKIYYIQLEWHPADDRIEVKYNTGNKGLRDGILMNFLRQFA